MKRVAIGLFALSSFIAPASAQSINIPGIGRIQIPIRIPNVQAPVRQPGMQPQTPQQRNARNDQPVIVSSPAQRADGTWSCSTSIDYPAVAKVTITEARLTDRPRVTGMSGLMMGDIRGYWVINYNIEVHPQFDFKASSGSVFDTANDSSGRTWKGFTADQKFTSDQNFTPAGTMVQRWMTYVSFDTDGKDVTTFKPNFGVRIDGQAPPNRPLDAPSASRGFHFPEIPANCVDRAPSGQVAGVNSGTATAAPALHIPHQFPIAGITKMSGKPGSIEEATQAGLIWSFGLGVPFDFDEGKRWYQEAQRRQVALHDMRRANEISQMLALYQVTDIESMFNSGLQKLFVNDWNFSGFWFGRVAEAGNAQGAAALGYVYADGRQNPRMQIYWCRKGFLYARKSRNQHELDAVNHFCPVSTFEDIMTPAERRANPASIARAKALSGALEHRYDQYVAQAREAMREAARNAWSSNSAPVDDPYDEMRRRDHAYATGGGSMPSPSTSGFYGNCHGGAFYGC